MIYALTLLNLILIFLLVYEVVECSNFLETLTVAVSFFVCIYCIVSGLWFWLDRFSFIAVLGSMAVVLLLFLGSVYIKRGISRLPEQYFNIGFIPCILIAIGCILTCGKFELFSTGQDQGLYQLEAIELYMGNYEVQHDFEEYQILEKEEDKEAYYDMLDEHMLGYYPISSNVYSPEESTEALSEVSGMYHGVQTFPALLALGAKLFGLSNMAQVQTVLYICTILCLYFAGKYLELTKRSSLISVALTGLSPLVIWISKSFFTEMLLTLLMTLYLYLLVDTSSKIKKILVFLPVAAFSFVHVSFLMLYPAFIIVNLSAYLRKLDWEYVAANIVSSISLILGCKMMSVIAPEYFYMNCRRLFWGNIITNNNLLYWVFLLALSGILLSVGLLCYTRKNLKASMKILNLARCIPIFLCVVIALNIVQGVKMGFFSVPAVENGLDSFLGTGMGAFTHLPLYALVLATGFLPTIYLIYRLIKSGKEISQYFPLVALSLLFIYCVLIQGTIVLKVVRFYYYYSRYLVFFIPVISLLVGLFTQRISRVCCVIIAGISCCSMLFFDFSLIAQKDDTMMEWATLDSLAESVEENAAIILEPEMEILPGPQLRALTSAAIFPVFNDFEDELGLLTDSYEEVYFLSDKEMRYIDGILSDSFEIVYRSSYMYWKNPNDSSKGIYPISFDHYKKEVILYRYISDDEYCKVQLTGGNIGVINGKRENEYIVSTGEPGTVIFGPYVDIQKGKYMVEIPIEILNKPQESLGNCTIYSGSEEILPVSALEDYLYLSDETCYLQIPIELQEDMSDVEIVINASEGSEFRIYPYTIYHN